MTDDSHPDNPSGELLDVEWTSFCYVLGELTAAEASQFEQLLAADQAAREAVARASQLCQALNQAAAPTAFVSLPAGHVEPNRLRRSPRIRTLGWLTVGSGIALALLVMFAASRSGGPETNSRSARELAVAHSWVTAREQYSDSSPLGVSESESVELGWDDLAVAELSLIDETRSDAGLVAPSWMVAAVASLDGEDDLEN